MYNCTLTLIDDYNLLHTSIYLVNCYLTKYQILDKYFTYVHKFVNKQTDKVWFVKSWHYIFFLFSKDILMAVEYFETLCPNLILSTCLLNQEKIKTFVKSVDHEIKASKSKSIRQLVIKTQIRDQIQWNNL